MDPLRYAFIVSQAELVASPEAASEGEFGAYAARAELEEGGGQVAVGIARADGRKCNRCWNYRCGRAAPGGLGCWGALAGVLCSTPPASPSTDHSSAPIRTLSCSTHVGADSEHPELCERCAPVVKEIGFVPPKVAEPVQA